jgi:glycosyltransferase involved in cell wall biosynthesis
MIPKKILFDFITLQDNIINGGMLYTQKILFELLNNEVIIYGLYNGNLPINERINVITEKYKINLLNIQERKIYEKINNLQIDTFFVGIAQRYNKFDLCRIKCKIVIVCHDLWDKSLEYFNISESKVLKLYTKKHLKIKKNIIKSILRFFLYPLVLVRCYYINKKNDEHNYTNFKKLIQLSNVFVITVSEYSKYSIRYFFGCSKNEIEVFYPPLIKEENTNVKAEHFNKIRDKKYFLLISVDRYTKNAALFLRQWEYFCLSTNNEYYCVLIGKIKANLINCIIFEKVNSNELAYLYKNAFAFIYPSLIEGFGYPPVEAASFGTPSICSNVTSIPEICGDMSIYFSPFYPEDLFKAMIKMTENREFYVEKVKNRFKEINQRQNNDLQKLINFILK